MKTTRFSLLVLCLGVFPVLAQEQQPAFTPPPETTVISMESEIEELERGMRENERKLSVFTPSTERTRAIASETNPDGPNGILFLDYGTDVILRANAALRLQTGGAVNQFWLHNNGHASFGASNDFGRLAVWEYGDGSRALNAFHRSTVETSVTQNDFGAAVQLYTDIAAGATNSGTLYGAHVEVRNYGPGLLANINALSVYAGNGSTGGGSTTSVSGIYTQVQSASGTIQTGYGVRIGDTLATNDWGIYQAGADDGNYFAGSVGIGTTAPLGKVHIIGGSVPLRVDAVNAGGFGAEFLDLTTYAYANGMALDMPGPSHISVGSLQLSNLGVPVVRSGSETSPLYLNRWSSTDVVIGGSEAISANIGLRVEGQGKSTFRGAVGIGTTTPDPLYKLHVVGDAYFQGVVSGVKIKAHYHDLAEWVPSVTPIAPATVVVLDAARSNHVSASFRSYDTSVAGVVSAQPGIALGEEGPSKVLIATTGRVLVRVDASSQPIAIGDLLVTSDKPGVAMKSIPVDLQGIALHRPGTVVGKALEPLASGEGEILVLLSLQ